MILRGYDDCRIGIIGENSFPWFLTFLSAVCGSNIAVPFDKGLTETELETCVARSGIKVLFYDKRFQNVVDHIKPSTEIRWIYLHGRRGKPQPNHHGRRG